MLCYVKMKAIYKLVGELAHVLLIFKDGVARIFFFLALRNKLQNCNKYSLTVHNIKDTDELV